MNSIKERLVGTNVGDILLKMRRLKEFHGISLKNPEVAAAVSNGIIADILIQKICPAGGTFLDIGAHIGSVLASVHQYDQSIKIFAVEADPQKASRIRDRFPYCTLYDVAVGERDDVAEFYINDLRSGYNTLAPNQIEHQRSIKVQVVQLDRILNDQYVDVIKIDIEGAELGAFRGGVSLISRCRPIIMFESAGSGINSLGYSPELTWAWFSENGYLIFTPDRVAHDAPPLSLSAFIDAHFYPFRSLNFFAIHEDRRTEVRDRARKILRVDPA